MYVLVCMSVPLIWDDSNWWYSHANGSNTIVEIIMSIRAIFDAALGEKNRIITRLRFEGDYTHVDARNISHEQTIYNVIIVL